MPPALARVQVLGGQPVAVPRSFLGVSTEYWALPVFDRSPAVLARALGLLRGPGEGPLILRVGGDSADHSFWARPSRGAPRWVYLLGPRWLRGAAALVRRLGARVILDLNLVTDTPVQALAWARAALAAFPRGSLAGFEVGNEPDLYQRRYWLAAAARRWRYAAPLPLGLTPAGYARSFGVYSRLLARAAPDVPLLGPAVAHPIADSSWVTGLLGAPHPGLRVISGHWYPYSACARPGAASAPTIGRLLAGGAIARFARGIGRLVRLAHRSGLALRLTELNSVTCGGRPGVSNTFATALWMPDALFAAARAGVQGANVHMRVRAVNAPFEIRSGRLVARPLLYGLALFARALGPGARLARVRLSEAPGTRLDVWAVRVRPRLMHVLLIDPGARAADVRLALPAAGPASVQRLLAPSPRSTAGVTLAGQRLGPDGRWWGAPRVAIARRGPRGYLLSVPRFSAALVSVALLPSPRHGPRLAGRLHPRRAGGRLRAAGSPRGA